MTPLTPLEALNILMKEIHNRNVPFNEIKRAEEMLRKLIKEEVK